MVIIEAMTQNCVHIQFFLITPVYGGIKIQQMREAYQNNMKKINDHHQEIVDLDILPTYLQ